MSRKNKKKKAKIKLPKHPGSITWPYMVLDCWRTFQYASLEWRDRLRYASRSSGSPSVRMVTSYGIKDVQGVCLQTEYIFDHDVDAIFEIDKYP